MHRILRQLLADIENAAIEREQAVRDAQTRMPMPASNFLVELSYDEAKQKFDEFLSIFMNNYALKDSLQPSRHDSAEGKFNRLLNKNNSDLGSWGKTSIELFYPAGYDLAFRLARTEAEGGIHQIVRTMFENMTAWSIDNKVKKLVQRTWGDYSGQWGEFINRVWMAHNATLHGTPEGRAQHVRDYKETYRAFLPVEYLEQSDIRSSFDFENVLQNHHKLIQRMRGLID